MLLHFAGDVVAVQEHFTKVIAFRFAGIKFQPFDFFPAACIRRRLLFRLPRS